MKKITLAILGIIAISSQAIMAADCEVCINFTVNNKTDYNFEIFNLTQLHAVYNRKGAISGFYEKSRNNMNRYERFAEVKAHEESTINVDPIAGNIFYAATQDNGASEGTFQLIAGGYLPVLPIGSEITLSPDSIYNENFKALIGQDESMNLLYDNINITITSKARDDMMVDIPSNGTQFTPYDFEVTISQIGKEELK